MSLIDEASCNNLEVLYVKQLINLLGQCGLRVAAYFQLALSGLNNTLDSPNSAVPFFWSVRLKKLEVIGAA